jgi:tight adherence protein C
MLAAYPPPAITAAAAMVVVSVIAMFWAIGGYRPKPERNLRTDAGEPAEGIVDQRALQLRVPVASRVVRPMLRAITERAQRLTPAGWVRSLERRLRLAGSPRRWPVERVLGAKLGLGITVLAVTILWISRVSLTAGDVTLTIGRFLLAPLVAFGAYMLPDLILALQGRERQTAIQLELPDALDQMTISVEAGLGFDAALQRYVASGTGPLVDELGRVLSEVAIGVSRRQAFQHLVDRTDVQELRHFVFAVTQADEYGLPIAQVLHVQAKELRVLRRQRAEERAMKIPVKIVLPLVMCIFPALFVVILVPAVIRILEALL